MKTQTEKSSSVMKHSGAVTPENGFEYFDFKQAAISCLRAGNSLGGPDGVLTTLVKELLEAALESEVEAHVEADNYTNPQQLNRNDYTSKTVKSEFGPFPVDTPRDRNGTFEPHTY